MEQFDHTRGTYVTATQVSIVRGGRDKLTVKKLGGGGGGGGEGGANAN